METLIIKVPKAKVVLIRMLFKELGITIQDKTKAQLLAEKIDKSIKPGPKPTMDEIVAEIREYRAGR